MAAQVIRDVDGFPLYVAWALPGASIADPEWRIAKAINSGSDTVGFLWADGDDELDNILASAPSLTYLPADFTLDPVVEIVPTGTRPGTAFQVQAPFNGRPVPLSRHNHDLLLGGVVMAQGSGINEYTFTGADILVGGAGIFVGDFFVCRVRL